jgi:hypothetical protein
MTLAYDYPLLGIFWSVLWIFILIAWLMTLFSIIVDVFRSHDMGGFAKALWLLFILFLPFLGVLVYLIARGHKMGEHAAQDAAAQEAAFRSYVQQTAASSGSGTADQLARLVELRDSGKITPEDFEAAKAKILV